MQLWPCGRNRYGLAGGIVMASQVEQLWPCGRNRYGLGRGTVMDSWEE